MLRLLALALIAAPLAGCPYCPGEGELRLLEGATTLGPGQSAQFEYRWQGDVRSTPGDCDAVWSVGDVVGGNTELGTVDACGRYTAPAAIPVATAVDVIGSDHGPFCHDCCPYAAQTVRLIPAAEAGADAGT